MTILEWPAKFRHFRSLIASKASALRCSFQQSRVEASASSRFGIAQTGGQKQPQLGIGVRNQGGTLATMRTKFGHGEMTRRAIECLLANSYPATVSGVKLQSDAKRKDCKL
jgi:hypothetical protein